MAETRQHPTGRWRLLRRAAAVDRPADVRTRSTHPGACRRRSDRACRIGGAGGGGAARAGTAVRRMVPRRPPRLRRQTNPGAQHATVRAQLKVMGDNVALRFPFAAATPAAVFRRADTLWFVFDTDADIKLDEVVNDPTHTIRGAAATRRLDAAVVRVKLDRPKLSSVAMEGSTWVITLSSEGDLPDPPARHRAQRCDLRAEQPPPS